MPPFFIDFWQEVNMNFISTRGGEKLSGVRAALKGIPADGGLFVPETFPALSAEELEGMLNMSYAERAAKIAIKYLDGLDLGELISRCEEAYSDFGGDPAPLVRIDDGVYMLELWHGPSCSYKDMSVALLPYLFKKCLTVCGEKRQALVLAAASADTSKSAAECFKDIEGFEVAAFYPSEGASKMQKLQLCAQGGENVHVAAVRGNYDACRAAARELVADGKFAAELEKRNTVLIFADSFNVLRLILQSVYYVSAYLDLVSGGQLEMGEEIDFALPVGNFGNAYSGYMAKRMGLPIRRIHCANNLNNAFCEFLSSGVYDMHREFCKTTSPSIDVLNASDLERLLFEISGRDKQLTASRMAALKSDLKFEVTAGELAEIKRIFDGGFANEETSVEAMYDVFIDTGYVMDTLTGCAMKVVQDWYEKNKKDETKIIIVSTANPYKFPQDVLYAVTGNDVKDSFKGVKRLHAATAMTVPKCISALRDKPARFTKTVDVKKIPEEILNFIG